MPKRSKRKPSPVDPSSPAIKELIEAFQAAGYTGDGIDSANVLLHAAWGLIDTVEAQKTAPTRKWLQAARAWVSQYQEWLGEMLNAQLAQSGSTGTIEFYRDTSLDREHRYQIANNNNKLLFETEGYNRVVDAENNVEAIANALVNPTIRWREGHYPRIKDQDERAEALRERLP